MDNYVLYKYLLIQINKYFTLIQIPHQFLPRDTNGTGDIRHTSNILIVYAELGLNS